MANSITASVFPGDHVYAVPALIRESDQVKWRLAQVLPVSYIFKLVALIWSAPVSVNNILLILHVVL